MSKESFLHLRQWVEMKRGRDCANSSRPLTETSTSGGAGMAVDSQYTDSESVFNVHQDIPEIGGA